MTSDLPGAFTVTAQPQGNLVYNLYGPSAIRPYQPGTYLTFEYANTGNASVPAPTVTIQAQNGLLQTPVLGLNLPQPYPVASLFTGGGGGGGGGCCASVEIVDLYHPTGSPSVTFVATGPPGQEGTIPPGYVGYYTIPFSPVTFGGDVTSSFSLLVPPQASTPIDWSSQEDTLRPSTIPADA